MSQSDTEVDFEADMSSDENEEILENTPVRKRTGDRWLPAIGFALATAAAFFPWYVFFNQESFGIAPMDGYSDTRDLSDVQGRQFVNVSPLAIPDEAGGLSQTSAFDPITTATVPDDQSEADGLDSGVKANLDQSFPGKPRYRLLHVANGRALIEDSSGMYVVRVGSVLPDNSRLATLEQRDGNWVIVTSDGQVVR